MTNELALRPQCDACGEFYELRPLARQTAEQRFCGVWYDHPKVGLRCVSTGSVLYPSAGLEAQLEAQAVVA